MRWKAKREKRKRLTNPNHHLQMILWGFVIKTLSSSMLTYHSPQHHIDVGPYRAAENLFYVIPVTSCKLVAIGLIRSGVS